MPPCNEPHLWATLWLLIRCVQATIKPPLWFELQWWVTLWSTHSVPRTLLLLSRKTLQNWNRFQNELPSDEGRELYHFLLHSNLAKIRWLGKKILVFWSTGYIYISRLMTTSVKLMTRTMDGCLILNKLERRREESDMVSDSDGNTAKLTVEMWAFLIIVFLPQPNFAPLSPKITWARVS